MNRQSEVFTLDSLEEIEHILSSNVPQESSDYDYESELLKVKEYINILVPFGSGTPITPIYYPTVTKLFLKFFQWYWSWITALPREINVYRQQNNLPPISLSNKLTSVAIAHVNDLAAHYPYQHCSSTAKFNFHSWSNHGNWQGRDGEGAWKGCCYPDNHSNSTCMWYKPREIAAYPGYGYEISATASSAQSAVASWKNSSGHNNVILNRGIWKPFKWEAIGGCYSQGYACAWFGTVKD
jgi:hypothetical protein